MFKLEGYCKVLWLMKMVECFGLLVLILIDIVGVWLGIDVELCGQFEVIVCNLIEMVELKVLIICIVIGEGGFGGVLVLGVGDCIVMLEYVVYLIIILEGCVLILWKDVGKVKEVVE